MREKLSTCELILNDVQSFTKDGSIGKLIHIQRCGCKEDD